MEHPPDLQAALTGLLEVSTMTLATVSPGGMPHAAPVYFAALWPGLPGPAEPPTFQLCFFSEAKSQHAQDIQRDPRLAVALYPEVDSWQEIRGLQMRGRAAHLPSGAGWDQAWAAYVEKFPFVRALKVVVARSDLYLFTPEWVRRVDNRQGFGFKQEWKLP